MPYVRARLNTACEIAMFAGMAMARMPVCLRARMRQRNRSLVHVHDPLAFATRHARTLPLRVYAHSCAIGRRS